MSNKHGDGTLFSEFPPTPKEKWIEKVSTDLKGADFNKKLVWRTLEGASIAPFYTSEDTDHLEYLKEFHNLNLNQTNPQTGARSWILFEKVRVEDEKAANKESQRAFHMGANGVNFIIDENRMPDLALLIKNIYPNINPVKFTVQDNLDTLLKQYKEIIERNPDLELNDIMGGFDYDPLMHYTLSGNLNEKGIEALAMALDSTKDIEDFKALTVNGGHFHNSGANAAQEIALVISAAVEYIERLRSMDISLKDFLSGLEFSMAVGTNYFMEIAKIRALRVLFYNILKAYEVKDLNPRDILIHCESSVWTKTIYDPYVNMLRNTTEAMSAILGGCNSLSISAFDDIFSQPTEFSKRISRNISNLLREESHFNKVSDPAAGSYYIEELTDKLIESGLEVFQEIEREGGFVQAFEKGKIQEMIEASRDKKHDLISKRKEVFIGTNQYPNPSESIDPSEITIKNPGVQKDQKILIPTRGTAQFEKLRLSTDRFIRKNGEDKRPTVFLSLMGENKVMRKARASFSTGFFGCAGFKVVESSPSPDLFKAVHKAIESKADIVVMCGADEDYLSSGVDYTQAYKANSNGILLIAGNPEENRTALIEAGVSDFINLRTNLIDSLRNFQVQLNIINA
jgi:methylmalonyl-CoA mutase